jgi:hypothetical protein
MFELSVLIVVLTRDYSGIRMAPPGIIEDAAVLYPSVHELLGGEEDSEISPPRRGGRRVKKKVESVEFRV